MTSDDSTDDRAFADEMRWDVSVLASTALSVLNDKSDEGSNTIRKSVVHILVKASLRQGAFNAEALVAELQDCRLNRDQIVDIYIPHAAHVLGEMWSDDTIGFAQVTIATARLQGLLTLLAPPWSAETTSDREGASILLILQSGDSHTLGPHVATAQLRRMGASVRILFGPDLSMILSCMAEEPYDLIMFSCSRAAALDDIARMVQGIRKGIQAPPPLALGGLILNFADRVKERTGVDLVTDDVKVAYKLCEKPRHKIKPVGG